MLFTKVRAHVTETLQEVRMMSYTIRVKTQTNTLKTNTKGKNFKRKCIKRADWHSYKHQFIIQTKAQSWLPEE